MAWDKGVCMLKTKGGVIVFSVEEIKAIIEKLPERDFIMLRKWILEKDWEKWDKEIEEHSRKGLLDFLVEEALEEKRAGKLKDL